MEDLFNKLLLETLEEGKQVGRLYHFTSYIGLRKIINSDLKLKGEFGNSNSVSFTRNKNFDSLSVVTWQVRIVLDGSSLSNRYKITPHSDIKNNYGRYSKKSDDTADESEERIDTSSYGGYVDIKPYLEVIEVRPYVEKDPDIRKQYSMLLDTIEDSKDKYERFMRFVDKFN